MYDGHILHVRIMRHVVIVPASFFLLSFVLRMSPAASEAVKVKDVLGNEEAKARRGKGEVFSASLLRRDRPLQ